MRLNYQLEEIPFLKDLVLDIEDQGETILTQASGPGSEMVAPYLKKYLDWLSARGSLGRFQGANVYSLYLPPVPSQAHARMVRGIIKTFFLKKPTPQAVTIGITRRCQYRCRHCSVPDPEQTRPSISRDEIFRVVRECLDLGVNNITFTGGEPLLNPDLEAFVAAVPKEKAVVQVFSNGLLLDERMAADLKKAGTYAVQISLDSPNPEEHDRWRGKAGAFVAVRRAVAKARAAGLLVGLSTYATNSALQEGSFKKIIDLAREWGVHEVSVFDVIPTGRLLRDESVLLTPESRKILRKQELLCNKSGNGLPRLSTQSWTNSSRGFAKSFGCLAGNYQFHISPCGDFMPCDFTPISFGNVRSRSVAALWEKLTAHPAYCRHQNQCRMQSPEFRQKYIHPIPENAALPISIEDLEKLPQR
ncbi:MAG: radical SAM protein [Thermodesulfobacteriota bacterium]